MKHKGQRILNVLVAIGIVLIPIAVSADTIPLEVGVGATTRVSDLYTMIALMYEFIVATVGILSAVMIMFGGLQWASSMGNAEKVSAAKERVLSALIGLVLALSSYALLNILNSKFVAYEEPEFTQLEFADDKEDTKDCASDKVRFPNGAADPNCTGVEEVDYTNAVSTGSTNTKKLQPSAASAFESFAAAFSAQFGGAKIQVNHMFRSAEYQACLREELGSVASSRCGSNHGGGTAVDLAVTSMGQEQYNWLACGKTTTCSYSANSKGWNKTSSHMGWSVLNYNPDLSAEKRTEQWHFDYGSSSICEACPNETSCGC